jgi:voltage-gated potassium channel
MNAARLNRTLLNLWSKGNGSFYLLAILFVTVFVVPPFVAAGLLPPEIVYLAIALVLFTGVFTVPCRTTVRLIALAIATCSFTMRFVQMVPAGPVPAVAEIVLSVLTFAIFAALIIKQFLFGGQAIKHRIAGAVAVYLILGLLWARLYELVKLYNPAAFEIAHDEGISTLFYFSFVTLMTIGYGDVVPVSLVARELAILEGLTGQLYLVILISSLIAQRSDRSAAGTGE